MKRDLGVKGIIFPEVKEKVLILRTPGLARSLER
jgi:hypothetical protein